MKLTKGLILFALAALVFTACKKEDDDDTPATKTKKELLTSGSWVGTDILIGGVSNWDSTEACSKDDYYTLKTDGSGTFDEGATKCDPGDPQSSPITWSLSSDEKMLTLDGDAGELTTLTETTMILKTTVPFFGTVEMRFKKK